MSGNEASKEEAIEPAEILDPVDKINGPHEEAEPTVTPVAEESPQDPEDLFEDDEDDEGELIWYAAIHATGHVTYHQDDRDPLEVESDWKFAKAYPILPNVGHGPSLTEEEWDHLEDKKRLDPKRFARKDAKVYAFSLGERVFDPSALVSVGPARDMYPPWSDERNWFDGDGGPDDGGDQPRTLPPEGGGGDERKPVNRLSRRERVLGRG